MAKKYYKDFSVTGVPSTTVLDSVGLSSPEGEHRLVVAVLINVSDYKDNLIEGWLEREKMLSIRDKVFSSDNATGTNAYRSTDKIIRLELNYDVPIGQTFKLGVNSGANATNLHGAYEYEIIS